MEERCATTTKTTTEFLSRDVLLEETEMSENSPILLLTIFG